jgi:PAS domain S-box-containing protein
LAPGGHPSVRLCPPKKGPQLNLRLPLTAGALLGLLDTDGPRKGTRVVVWAGLAAAYAVAARIGFLVAFAHPSVSSVWPPAGLALAAVLVFGRQAWPGVLVGAFLANVLNGVSAAVALGIAVGNTLEAVLGAALLGRIGFRNDLSRLQDVFGLASLAAIVSTAVSATGGVLCLCLGGFLGWANYGRTWTAWWLGDAIGILLLTPALLTWSSPLSLSRNPTRVPEGAVLVLGIAGASYAVFGGWYGGTLAGQPLAYVLFPFVVWAALRFGPAGTSAVTLVLSVIATWGTIVNGGPSRATGDALFSVQAFLAVASLTGLVLAAALAERHGAERSLRQSEERYRSFFEANLAGAIVSTPDGRLVDANPVALLTYGASSIQEMKDLDLRALWAEPALRDRIMERVRREGRADQQEITIRRRDGRLMHLLGNFVGEFDPAHQLLAVRSFFFDVSERKLLEEQVRQAQKMEAVGRLAGGVAHDFNNLLGVITGYSDMLSKNLQPHDANYKRLGEIKKAAERAAALTRQLLAFSRQEVIQPKVLDLNVVVRDIEKTLQRLIGEDVHLATRLAGDLGRVKADRGQVDQVILNLAVNARDAMPQGGDLIIETSNSVLDEAYAASHADVVPGAYVMLSVTDTGHGMDATTLSHVFEPFFSTKEEGKGTGLGLATIFGIAKQSRGHVSVSSEPSKGASFKVYLPRVDAVEDLGRTTEEATQARRGTETILLVEDAEALRTMVREILEAAGYTVIESTDPRDAVLRAESHAGALDLILTDVVMPHMSGPEVVRAVQATRPSVKVLFMSGYTNEAIGRQGVLEQDTHLLQKPFSSDALLGSVRAALDHDRELHPSDRDIPRRPDHPAPTAPHPGAHDVSYTAESDSVQPGNHTRSRPHAPSTQTVLVIDDDSEMRSLFRAQVTSLGLDCVEAADGISGLAQARQALPGVILLDINLPLMDGRQILALLKEDPVLRWIPVIVISGSDETELAGACVERGAEDYLSKPVNATLLRARVRSSLEKSRLREHELALQGRLAQHGLELEERVKEKTRSLVEAHERLTILDEAKDGFLSLIAHELRTPATGVLGATELLASGELDERGRVAATDLLSLSVERLLRLVEDALLLTTIKTSVEALSLRSLPLTPIWASARERALSVAVSRDVGIESLARETGSVLCDEALLQQALAALLECAARFTAPGETVGISLTRASDSVQMRLQARGHSLPKEAMATFFEALSMGKRVAPGGDLGLGPAVAAQILRLMGGSVVVDTIEGGICFTVTLKAVGMAA